MSKKYIVQLRAQERQTCEDTMHKLSGTSQKANRAWILLHTDADGPDRWTDREIAKPKFRTFGHTKFISACKH